MGFMVNGTPIPDPTKFTGAVSDLDLMGKRDATGYLHRERVATKHPLKMEYTNISWQMICYICGLLKDDKFTFTYRDPAEGQMTFDAYVGDREWEVVRAVNGEAHIGTLKFSVIQY
jgi:hypothetical protein